MNLHSWVEISESALLHNIALYKDVLPAQATLAPVIKSNAYGHGLVEIASILNKSNLVGYLCVVSLSEAIMLRAQGIAKPLLVLSILDNDLEKAVIHDIDLVLYDEATAIELSKLAQTLRKSISVHIKVDTGLSRLGIFYKDAEVFIKKMTVLPYINIKGIFSHFAASERSDLSFSHLQIERLNTLIKNLKKDNITIPFKHISCSGAVTSLPASHYNFARLGISTYGLWSSVESKIRAQTIHPHFNLKPVMTWKTKVIARKSLPTQSFIGYDCTYQTMSPTETAILPIGYFDGYERHLSNQAVVKIKDHYFPVRGRIAMNLCIVDVSTMPEIKIGDEVTLLSHDPLLSAETLAEKCLTINYEIASRINPLISRIIVP